METVALHGPRLGVDRLCRALAVPRATYYRHLEAKAPPPRPTPARALTVVERRAVLDVLHEPGHAGITVTQRYMHLAPSALTEAIALLENQTSPAGLTTG